MPARNPELPEGTDHIINGAMDPSASSATSGGAGGGGTGAGGGTTGGTGALSGGSAGATAGGGATGSNAGTSGASTGTGSSTGGGFVASSNSDDTGGTSTGGGSGGGNSAAQKIVGAARTQVNTLTDQATTKIREYADQGKDRATSALDEFAQVLDQAARDIDERFGGQYGDYGHRAAGAVTSLSQNLRGKTVDDLLNDSRELIRKSPAAAVGTAAVLGFALVRLIKAGLDEDSQVEFRAESGRNISFQPETGGTSDRGA